MIRSIETTLIGEEAAVRERVDGLLAVLGDLARFLQTQGGAAVSVGMADDPYDDQRWSNVCDSLRDGHEDIGTMIHLLLEPGDDRVMTPDDFRRWVERIVAGSGLTPPPGRALYREYDGAPIVTSVTLPITPTLQAELDALLAATTPPAEDELPTELAGIAIAGWGRLQEEMELSIIAGQMLDARQREVVAALAKGWVEDGTATGFGGGSFHGWTSGEWHGHADYHFDVDSGSQDVDWQAALDDLARRLAATVESIGCLLSIRLGPPLD